MKVICKGIAKLKITETGEIININSQDVDWEQDGGDERSMGAESRYVADYEFSSSETKQSYQVSWQLWEYPEGVENFDKTEISEGIEVLQDFEYGLVHEPDFE